MRVRNDETARPINRSGSESSQTKGHATRTINANGQLSRNKMHQPISSNSAFMGSGLMRHNGDCVQRHNGRGLTRLLLGRILRNRVEAHQH